MDKMTNQERLMRITQMTKKRSSAVPLQSTSEHGNIAQDVADYFQTAFQPSERWHEEEQWKNGTFSQHWHYDDSGEWK